MIKTQKINKSIVFFYYETIDKSTLDEIIEFVSSSAYVLISDIKLILNNKSFTSIEIGLNINGSVSYTKLLPKMYYYFRGGEIHTTRNINDINFW